MFTSSRVLGLFALCAFEIESWVFLLKGKTNSKKKENVGRLTAHGIPNVANSVYCAPIAKKLMMNVDWLVGQVISIYILIGSEKEYKNLNHGRHLLAFHIRDDSFPWRNNTQPANRPKGKQK